MALGTSQDVGNIKRYVKSTSATLYLSECDSSGTRLTSGDGTIWVTVGTLKGTKIAASTSDYSDTDDRGIKVVDEETLEGYEISTTLMQRDSASRLMCKNAAGKYYQAVIVGNTIGTKTEAHAFAICRVGQKWDYEIGGTGQISGITIKTVSNPVTLSVTPPTAAGTTAISIAAGDMWGTADQV